MPWYSYLAWFFAGAFLMNSVPHMVQGISGNKFQTPFARPPGVGESSSMVNVIWGFANLVIGGGLLHLTWPASSPPPLLCLAALIGALALALYLARHFSRVRHAPPQP
ncbi:MAG: hypothetical protein JOZ74_13025 [Bradyrhizobium sp.]|nr:hypothetical protein [Bradyrhizobium sp.]